LFYPIRLTIYLALPTLKFSVNHFSFDDSVILKTTAPKS